MSTENPDTGPDQGLLEMTNQMQGLGLSTILEQGASTSDNPSTGDTTPGPPQSGVFLDEDDLGDFNERERKFFGTVFGHLKALQTAVSIPLFEVVHKFDGDPRNFRTWIRELERYSQIAKLSESELSKIAHLTCSGPVADFIKRYFEENNAKKQVTSWTTLKALLDKRFGDITDAHQALAQLRQIRQGSDEPVQLYGEKFLKVAELAYPDAHMQKETKEFIQRQLVDVFCDGLYFDYLRMKVLREQPRTFDAALALAMREQTLRRRFNMRADSDRARDYRGNDKMNWGSFESSIPNYNYWDIPNSNSNANYRDAQSANQSFQDSSPRWGFTDHNREKNRSRDVPWSGWSNAKNPRVLRNSAPLDTRSIEPMEIGAMKRQMCMQCGGQGHRASLCPSKRTNWRRGGSQNVYVAEANTPKRERPPQPQSDVPDWIKRAECFICHRIGHLSHDCPQRYIPDRNRVPYYQNQWNGPRGGYGPQAQNGYGPQGQNRKGN
jgi:hypothetical protein